MTTTSIPRPESQSWSCWLLPSAADIIFLVLFLSLALGGLAPRLLNDAGTGWHIRDGQLILQSHAVTRQDAFSASVGGQSWYAWEWLYDAGIAAVHARLSLSGVVLLTALLIALVFALVMRLTIRAGATLPAAASFILLSVGASSIHFFARPHVLSWLFTAVWFWVLDSVDRDAARLRLLYWLPVIMVVWVNLHGGFVVGFVLLALHWASALWRRELPALKAISVAGLLCLAASFVNPYGYQLHLHVYRYLSDRFLMDHIDEFQSPNFHGMPQQCFAALLLLTFFALGMRRGKIRVSQLLVLLFAVYSGLFASRNLPVSSILMMLIAAPILSRALSQVLGAFVPRWKLFSARVTAVELRARGHLWPLVVTVGLLVAFFGGHNANVTFSAARFPVRTVDYVAQRGIAGPIFCPDYWGGYLIYRLYPENKVFVDDRHDLYGDEFLRQYLKAIRVEPGWNKILDQRDVRWALLPNGSALANMLQQTSQWSVRSSDDTSILLERN